MLVTAAGVFLAFGSSTLVAHHVGCAPAKLGYAGLFHHSPELCTRYARAKLSLRNVSPVAAIAQAMRASLLASATVTSRAGFFAISSTIQKASAPLCFLATRNSEDAPTTSSLRK